MIVIQYNSDSNIQHWICLDPDHVLALCPSFGFNISFRLRYHTHISEWSDLHSVVWAKFNTWSHHWINLIKFEILNFEIQINF